MEGGLSAVTSAAPGKMEGSGRECTGASHGRPRSWDLLTYKGQTSLKGLRKGFHESGIGDQEQIWAKEAGEGAGKG